MSRFKTMVPISLGEVIRKLPARSYVESVEISADRKSAEVVWGCDDFKTGYTFPVEVKVEDLGRALTSAATDGKTDETPTVNVKDLVDTRRKGGRKATTA